MADRAHRLRRPAVLAAIGIALVALVPVGLATRGPWDADYPFLAVTLAQAALYLAAAQAVHSAPRTVPRTMLAIVLIVAAALRLPLLFAPAQHSPDISRYVWDGRVQAHGINPYRYVPSDPALTDLRDGEIYPEIDRRDYAVTIYPPVAQMLFLAFTRVGETVLAVKAGWLLLEAAAMLGLLALLDRLKRPRAELLLYAWHPLPVWEIAGDGHVDAGMTALLVLAMVAWTGGRKVLTGVLLAASVLIKPLTIAALPAFWRPWDWKLPAAFAGGCLAAYLPYLGVGAGVIGFLPAYLGEEGVRSGGGFLLLELLQRILGPLPAVARSLYLAAGAALLAALALRAIGLAKTGPEVTAASLQVLLLAGLLVLSPNYPWYFLVLVPLGCLHPWWPARVLTLMSFVLFAAPPIDGVPRTVAVQSILYGTVIVTLAIELYYRRRNPHVHRQKDGTETPP